MTPYSPWAPPYCWVCGRGHPLDTDKTFAAREENADLKRGWQAVRAAVEQHSVAGS